MDGKIAIEEHFSTDLNNELWDAKREEGRNGRDYTRDIERRLLDADHCVHEMDRAGIEFCIMSLTSPGVQSVVDPKRAVELARSANDYAAGIISKHPSRMSAFAAVALQDPKAAGDELERAVGDLGFKGACIM
jgi:2,3-dihydroxybenzoate decarboxylase